MQLYGEKKEKKKKIKLQKRETKIQQLPCNPELILSLNNATATGFSQ